MGVTKTKRVLQPKVTVASVKRQWEEKYSELSHKYDVLVNAHHELAAHMDLAQRTDEHSSSEEQLAKDLTESLTKNIELIGILKYLETKLENLRGTNNSV